MHFEFPHGNTLSPLTDELLSGGVFLDGGELVTNEGEGHTQKQHTQQNETACEKPPDFILGYLVTVTYSAHADDGKK